MATANSFQCVILLLLLLLQYCINYSRLGYPSRDLSIWILLTVGNVDRYIGPRSLTGQEEQATRAFMNEDKSQTKSVCKPFRNQLIALKSAQKRLFLNKTETTAKSLRRILGPKMQRKQIGISFQWRDNTIVSQAEGSNIVR